MTQMPGQDVPLIPSNATEQHRAAGPQVVRAAVVTISDTRTSETDTSGQYLRQQLAAQGHELVDYALVRDDALEIRAVLTPLLHRADLIITSGGTGIAGRDVTIPVVESLLVKPIPGFGELFRMLSYQQVRGAAMLSRALGGLTRGSLLFALPGSLNAVQTAWEGILKDEIGHLVFEVARQGQLHQPAVTPGAPLNPVPLRPEATRPALLSTHINQGASAGIGRHAGVIGEVSQFGGQATGNGLGRHAYPTGTIRPDSEE